MNSVKVSNQLLANSHAKAYIAARSTKQKLERILLPKWKLLQILLIRLDLKVSLWLVSIKLQKQLLKQSKEYYQSEKMVAGVGKVAGRESYRIVN